jgi:hypothetical protein
MGNGHLCPRYVSGESCLTVTSTLVSYVLLLIYTVPRVYRLSPTHSCHILFSYIRCLVSTACHQHTRAIYCSHIYGASCLPPVTNTLVPYIVLIYTVPRVYRLSPTHSCHILFSCVRRLVTVEFGSVTLLSLVLSIRITL